MAKLATNGGPTKTQLIQDFYNQGIISGKEILANLEEAGQPSTKSMVYTTISKMKRKQGGGEKTRGGRKGTHPASVSNGATGSTSTSLATRSNGAGSISLAELAAISELAKRVGGVEHLRRVLDSLVSLG